MPPASAIACTAAAATGSSGLTPHHAQESTVCGGVGGTAACADGVATPKTNVELITSAAKFRVRRDRARESTSGVNHFRPRRSGLRKREVDRYQRRIDGQHHSVGGSRTL